MINYILDKLEKIKLYHEFGMALPQAIIDVLKEVYHDQMG